MNGVLLGHVLISCCLRGNIHIALTNNHSSVALRLNASPRKKRILVYIISNCVVVVITLRVLILMIPSIAQYNLFPGKDTCTDKY